MDLKREARWGEGKSRLESRRVDLEALRLFVAVGELEARPAEGHERLGLFSLNAEHRAHWALVDSQICKHARIFRWFFSAHCPVTIRILPTLTTDDLGACTMYL